MATTTIRIEDELKARLATVAERAGKTPHAFILEAVAKMVEQAEIDEELQRIAEQRWAHLLETGRSIAWEDARDYMLARARGERPSRPIARKPSR